MSDFSAILKKYVINNGTYVDKKMEPLKDKDALNEFRTSWMFPGLKVTVIKDEDGQMRDYRCEVVDGEKVWVPVECVSQAKLDDAIAKIEKDYKKADDDIADRIENVESFMTIEGSDIEK